MKVRSLGFRTDLMIRRLAGSEVTDHGDYLVDGAGHFSPLEAPDRFAAAVIAAAAGQGGR